MSYVFGCGKSYIVVLTLTIIVTGMKFYEESTYIEISGRMTNSL